MTTELYILTLAALLQVVQFVLMAIPANLQLGTKTTAGPRDEPLPLSGVAGRLKRAMDNHFEGLILFTIAVVVVTLADQSSPVTEWCAHAYLVARILYIPAYAQGLAPWRSVIWMVGFIATLIMLIAALI
ncbi:MAPEG family protein [Litoreibacter roseus]|uniref:Membrane protein n=1 Tax=Litoreibacter roseus TaxID=2601869 RepID=A0A6N6JB75_9RHOB|nr:MAPEG family protein [Litoreibacter roseus]GFE63247.1 membrane protein [Litoreibacter roseus]